MASKSSKATEAVETPSVELEEEANVVAAALEAENAAEPVSEAPEGAENVTDNNVEAEEIPLPGEKISARDAARKRTAAREERERKIAEIQSDLIDRSALKDAVRKGATFDVKIVSVGRVGNGAQQEVVLNGLINGTTRAKIGFFDYFPRSVLDESKTDTSTQDGIYKYSKRKLQIAEKQIKNVQPICVKEVIEDEHGFIIVGSRLEALKKISNHFYGGENPRLRVGDEINALVTAVSLHSLVLNAGGVDVVMTQSRLTYRWMYELIDNYKVGDTVPAKIKSVTRKEDGGFEVELDTIAVELENARERQYLVNVGDTVFGIITQIHGKDKIVILTWLKEFELPARCLRINHNDFGCDMKAGHELRMKVVGFDKNGMVVCQALNQVGNGSFFKTLRIQ